MLKALRPFHAAVGNWKGTGTSQTSAGWSETAECTWGFRERDGRVSLNFYFEGDPHFTEAIITYDLEKKRYQFIGRDKNQKTLRFEGPATGSQTLQLERVDDAKDKFDRVEIKVVRAGDKLIYTLSTKKGRSFFDRRAEVELFREGRSAEEFLEGPFCPVTGGAGRVPVEYEGKTYHVACPASKEEFLRRAAHYTKKPPQ